MGAADMQPFHGPGIQADKAGHAAFIGEHTHGQRMVKDFHAPGPDGMLQRLGHVAAGQRPRGGRAPAGVVIRLITHILAVFVRGKRHAQRRQLEEAPGGVCGLAQGGIAMHIAALERLCHVAHTVRVIAGKGQLVVGLLVAARVAGGAAEQVFCHQGQVTLAQGGQGIRRVQPRAARADHHRADCAFLHGHSLLRAKPPSASSTCPAA